LTKILLIVAVIAVVYFIMRGYARSLSARPPAYSPDREDDMVRCGQCGVHLPRSESVRVGAHFYCSEEHRKLHGR
jgi:uncharacterized protein